jgi:hypothetical protein
MYAWTRQLVNLKGVRLKDGRLTRQILASPFCLTHNKVSANAIVIALSKNQSANCFQEKKTSSKVEAKTV